MDDGRAEELNALTQSAELKEQCVQSAECFPANGTDSGDLAKEEDKEAPSPSRCALCCAACLLRCRPCMTQHNPLSPHPTVPQRLRYAFMCPPHGKLARFLALLLAVLCAWGFLWGLTGPHAVPGGNIFGLVVLVVCASIGGLLVQLIRLPPLLGRTSLKSLIMPHSQRYIYIYNPVCLCISFQCYNNWL